MELSILVLCVFNFILVWLLPLIFFRDDGKKNFRWFMTALPFMLAPLIPVLEFANMISPTLTIAANLVPYQIGVCTFLPLMSVFLIAMTMGTHRIPVALWHQRQEDDEPACIVTWGAYAKIRHPFYTSFILASISLVLLTLHWGAVLILAYVLCSLTITARKEEKRLSTEKGDFGPQYQEYMTTTGRFFPRLI